MLKLAIALCLVALLASWRGRTAALIEFVAAMKSTGFVARALARHGIEGAAVAP